MYINNKNFIGMFIVKACVSTYTVKAVFIKQWMWNLKIQIELTIEKCSRIVIVLLLIELH